MTAVSSLRSRYPLGVIVVAAIALFRSISIVADITQAERDGVLGWIANSGPLPDMPPGTDVRIVATAVLVGLLVASVLVVIGLVLQKRWAWVLAIITAGMILAIDLGWWFSGEPRYGSMLLNSIAVFYLNQRDVRVALRGESTEP
jgi:uncharacterized membrane protein YphA (DoxX/SURF4 family)